MKKVLLRQFLFIEHDRYTCELTNLLMYERVAGNNVKNGNRKKKGILGLSIKMWKNVKKR